MIRRFETIEAGPVLEKFHGENAIACTTVQRLTATLLEARFVIPYTTRFAEGVSFDEFTMGNKNSFTFLASQEGAGDFFANQPQVDILPASAILGAVINVISNSFLPQPVLFEALNAGDFIVPGRAVNMRGRINTLKGEKTQATFTLRGERRPFVKGLQVENNRPDPTSLLRPPFPQHWLVEHNAQSLAVLGLSISPKNDRVPILTSCGRSYFAPMPLYSGDNVISRLRILQADKRQVVGSVENFLDQVKIAEQEEVVIELLDPEEIVQRTKKVVAAA